MAIAQFRGVNYLWQSLNGDAMKRARVILPVLLLSGACLLVLCGFRAAAPESFDHRGRSVESWIEDLRAEDYTKRSAAFAAIGEMDLAVTPHLVHELQQREPEFLGKLATLAARFGLGTVPSGEAARRRSTAATALAGIPEAAAAAVPALCGLLADEDAAVSSEAERALRMIGEPAIPRVLETLEDGNAKERTAAVRLIRDVQSTSAEALKALHLTLADDAPDVRCEAAVSLGRVGAPEANIAPLVRALADTTARVREAAARSLGEFGPRAQRASNALKGALLDDNAEVRIAAAEALWKIDGNSRAALPPLVGAMRDASVRWRAVMVISSMEASAEPAIPFLITALKDEAMHRPFRDPPLSALALGRIGAPAWPALLQACRSRDENTRIGAALALRDAGNLAGAAERAAMRALLKDKSTTVRHAAAMALIAMDASDESLVPALEEMLHADDDVLRLAAVDSLKKISPELAWQLRDME